MGGLKTEIFNKNDILAVNDVIVVVVAVVVVVVLRRCCWRWGR
jgi:hypothetical protein